MSARPAPTAALVASGVLALALSLAGAVQAEPGEPADAGAPLWRSCTERVPTGARRPEIAESFADRGLSGYAVSLEITVKHGKGETVLPDGFKVPEASDAARGLRAAGFAAPDRDGGSGPTITREENESGATTKLSIPFVPLPKEAGRNDMTLPPVPITVARASGELTTVCTAPHAILVDDPTANEVDPQVKPNPPPRPQREPWELAKQVAIGIVIGAIAMAIAAWLYARWKKTPRLVKLPPPKLPWVRALEELDEIRQSTLLAEGKTGEYFDRVSDSVRKYLGARYGFDGLETTTDEMRGFLKRVRPPIARLKDITAFLEDCDLVKFARVEPADSDCLAALESGETIVGMTIPPSAPLEPGAREAA